MEAAEQAQEQAPAQETQQKETASPQAGAVEQPEQEETQSASAPKRKRRTQAEIQADEQAAKDAIRAELLAELRDQGLLLEGAEGRRYGEKALEKFSLIKLLSLVQSELRVPKMRTGINKATGETFNFRTADDVIAEAKKIAGAYGCSIYVNYKVEYHSDNFAYIVAQAHFCRISDGEEIVVEGYARDPFYPSSMTGKNPTQCTGSASTYAKKQALTAMFCLDDSDSDPDMAGARMRETAAPQTQALPVPSQTVSAPAAGTAEPEKGKADPAPSPAPAAEERQDVTEEASGSTVQENTAAPEQVPATTGKTASAKKTRKPSAKSAAPAQDPSDTLPAPEAQSAEPASILDFDTDISKVKEETAAEIAGLNAAAATTPSIFGESEEKPALIEGSPDFFRAMTQLCTDPGEPLSIRTILEQTYNIPDTTWDSLMKMSGRA